MNGLEAIEIIENDEHKKVIDDYYRFPSITKKERGELYIKHDNEYKIVKKELKALRLLIKWTYMLPNENFIRKCPIEDKKLLKEVLKELNNENNNNR